MSDSTPAQPAPQIVYVTQPARRSGLSVAALVLGIIGIVLTTIPLVGAFLGGILDLLAIVLGIIGSTIDGRNKISDKMGVVGVLLGLLAIIGIFFTGAGTIW